MPVSHALCDASVDQKGVVLAAEDAPAISPMGGDRRTFGQNDRVIIPKGKRRLSLAITGGSGFVASIT